MCCFAALGEAFVVAGGGDDSIPRVRRCLVLQESWCRGVQGVGFDRRYCCYVAELLKMFFDAMGEAFFFFFFGAVGGEGVMGKELFDDIKGNVVSVSNGEGLLDAVDVFMPWVRHNLMPKGRCCLDAEGEA